jgi:hypothetical protein
MKKEKTVNNQISYLQLEEQIKNSYNVTFNFK